MEHSFRISELIAKDIRGVISEDELEQLRIWINSSETNRQTYLNAVSREKQMEKLQQYRNFQSEEAWSKVERAAFGAKTISLFNRTIVRYAAAVLIPLMMLGGAGYWYYEKVYTRQFSRLDLVHAPGTNKAVLLMPNGNKTYLGKEAQSLDSKETGLEIIDDGTALSYSDKSYEEHVFSVSEYHQLLTPAGGTYELFLADGTHVWLNAGSQLRFPASFTDSTRRVILEGEAYFDVVHDGKPFIVSTEDMDVRVMGTSFNITSYDEDSDVKTTLLEGVVRVEVSAENGDSGIRQLIYPDQQAVLGLRSSGIQVKEVDASSYASWVKGKMEFNNETLDQVLRKLSRWYDFRYRFDNEAARQYHFSGRLNREENISSILSMLELTTDVKFKVYNNQVVVK